MNGFVPNRAGSQRTKSADMPTSTLPTIWLILSSAYPVKVISPTSSHDRRAVLAFVLSYGGGVVPGDKVTIDVQVNDGCRLGLLAQGTTELYTNHDRKLSSIQTLTATVGDGAALLMIPDPLQPFKDSVYEQRQVFHVHPNANLLLLYWISEDRRAMGEVWNLTRLKLMNELWRLESYTASVKTKPRLLIRDNIILDAASHPESIDSVSLHVKSMGVSGTLIRGGTLFENLYHFFLGEFTALPRVGEINWAAGEDDPNKVVDSDVTWSVASIRGYAILKFGAQEAACTRCWLRRILDKEGTIAREFRSRFLTWLQDK